jgi:hypothetical protein
MLRYLADELPRLLVRLAVALLVYDLLLRIPWPPEAGRWMALGSTGFFTAAVLIICGKFLYDTLFYDRFWRQADNR